VNFWKVILATIVIFGTGVMTGSLLVNHVQYLHTKASKRPEAAVPANNSIPPTNGQSLGASKSPRLPEFMSKQFLQRLNEELRLAPEQHEAIQKIITDGQNLMHKTMQDARLEIREQLTPEQRSKFDELVKRPPRRPANSTNAPPVLPPANAPAAAPTNAPGT
jgi:Spy/CpxP family protein refolding chaperone